MNQNEQQAFEIELRKELNQLFPQEFIPQDFHFYADCALQYQSLISLRIDYETYERLTLYVNGTLENISFFELSFLINCIISATPHQLTASINGPYKEFNYLQVQKDVNELSTKWNDLVNPIKESVQRKIKAHIIRGMNPSNGLRIN